MISRSKREICFLLLFGLRRGEEEVEMGNGNKKHKKELNVKIWLTTTFSQHFISVFFFGEKVGNFMIFSRLVLGDSDGSNFSFSGNPK
jgi:hypothetical protein